RATIACEVVGITSAVEGVVLCTMKELSAMMLALLTRAVLSAALLATGSATMHASPVSGPPLPDPGYCAPDSHPEGVSGVTLDSMVIEEVAQSGHKMRMMFTCLEGEKVTTPDEVYLT
ncbi:hypothetical protein FOZ63_018549, partial [Perkinsus olseni]